MAVIVSAGSGKGGTGKTTIISNLATLLAQSGRRVCILDLDVGGANVHVFFGLFEPQHTLSDFLSRRVNSLNDIKHALDSFHGLEIIPGTGETLQSANMTFQEKSRLLRAIPHIDTDILFIDVGAGTSYNNLDFFMAADLQICTTMAEPTSIADFQRFLQLATIRKTLTRFLSRSEVSRALKNNSYATIAEVFETAEHLHHGAKAKIQAELANFHPLLITNRVTPSVKLNSLKLKTMAKKFLGISLPELGEIPEDAEIRKALQAYMPVCEFSPQAEASLAIKVIEKKFSEILTLFESE